MFGRKSEEVEITISNKTVLRIIAFGIGTYAGFRFFDNIRHPLTLIFVSFFLALALNPAVSFVTRKLKSKSRMRGTAVAYLAVMTVLISVFSLVIPPIVRQSSDFVQSVPQTLREIETQDSTMGRFVRRYNLEKQVANVANDWASNIGDSNGPVITTANRIIANIVSFVAVLVLTFMMLVEGPEWIDRFTRRLPKNRRNHITSLLEKMYELVTKFVNAQVLIAVIAAVFAAIALTIMSSIFNVSINIIALAGLVALFGIIPTIGNIIAAVVVSIVCLFSSLPLAIAMLVFFIVYQQIENATIQPYIQARNNDLTPMLVFIAALIGIGFGGILGGFVAIPIAGCTKILIEDYLDERMLPEKK